MVDQVVRDTRRGLGLLLLVAPLVAQVNEGAGAEGPRKLPDPAKGRFSAEMTRQLKEKGLFAGGHAGYFASLYLMTVMRLKASEPGLQGQELFDKAAAEAFEGNSLISYVAGAAAGARIEGKAARLAVRAERMDAIAEWAKREQRAIAGAARNSSRLLRMGSMGLGAAGSIADTLVSNGLGGYLQGRDAETKRIAGLEEAAAALGGEGEEALAVVGMDGRYLAEERLDTLAAAFDPGRVDYVGLVLEGIGSALGGAAGTVVGTPVAGPAAALAAGAATKHAWQCLWDAAFDPVEQHRAYRERAEKHAKYRQAGVTVSRRSPGKVDEAAVEGLVLGVQVKRTARDWAFLEHEAAEALESAKGAYDRISEHLTVGMLMAQGANLDPERGFDVTSRLEEIRALRGTWRSMLEASGSTPARARSQEAEHFGMVAPRGVDPDEMAYLGDGTPVRVEPLQQTYYDLDGRYRVRRPGNPDGTLRGPDPVLMWTDVVRITSAGVRNLARPGVPLQVRDGSYPGLRCDAMIEGTPIADELHSLWMHVHKAWTATLELGRLHGYERRNMAWHGIPRAASRGSPDKYPVGLALAAELRLALHASRVRQLEDGVAALDDLLAAGFAPESTATVADETWTLVLDNYRGLVSRPMVDPVSAPAPGPVVEPALDLSSSSSPFGMTE